MKKGLNYILILLMVVGIFIPTHFTHAGWLDSVLDPGSIITNLAGIIFQGILYLVSWITGLSGLLLNYVLKYTVIDMRANIAGLTGINIAWGVIKDVMNIFFIFMLIYEGILLIIGQGNTQRIKKFIIGLVLASVLINFSLFFTKVMIDASNIVTLGFYNAMLIPPAGNTTPPGEYGLSNPIFRTLGLTSLFGANADASFGAGKGFGAMFVMLFGSISVMVVTFFVFFAIAILFMVRYIILIFLLMLSPVAYMGMALPFMAPYARQWWESFKGQLLFGPVYMMLTWVVLTLMSQPGFITGTNDLTAITNSAGGTGPAFTSMGLIVNFALIIGLLITSLIASKSIATQGSKLIGQATGMMTGFAGGAIMGGAAWAGRKTVGNLGNMAASSAKLQEDADKKTGVRGAWARTKLYTAQTARDATYDVRNAAVPTGVIGDLTRGTVGRTTAGKFIGLDNAQTSNIQATAGLASLAGFGKGGTRSYVDEKAASEKEKNDREAKAKNELELAQARDAILTGAKSGATQAEIDIMEQKLAKLSEKQTLALIEGNEQLLQSQNFANKISVKTLEAIEKSDKFSDQSKNDLKTNRFKEIEALYDPAALAAYTAASAVPAGSRSATQISDIKRIDTAKARVKGLSDSELEMMDPTTHLSKSEVISEMRPAQFASIAKSSKFTSTQKKDIKDRRLSPLFDALDTSRTNASGVSTYSPDPALVKKMITKGLNVKDVAGLMGTNATFVNYTGSPVTESILVHPEVMEHYTPNMLKQMANQGEMNTQDIQTIRDAIDNTATAPGTTPSTHMLSLATWLSSRDGMNNFS